jgi:RNA 2',3'-cyclic 3'-phosphodiesterase
MRAFVAIDLPPLQGPLPPELRPEDHVTLHFFEELPVERVAAAVEAMAEAAEGITAFDLELRGVGAFPDGGRPRVVWAAVGEGKAPLQSLTDRLRRALAARGFSIEHRPFVPHLTLSRVRSPRDAGWARGFLADPENVTRVWTRGRVTEILLKESELLPSGARHTVRERVMLPAVP